MTTPDKPQPETQGDIAPDFAPYAHEDCVRRNAMIPMRDGIKLYTEILIPQGAEAAPLMLERTPYSALKCSRLSNASQAQMQLYAFHAELLAAGYIVVLQDVRGKHKSEGRYEMNLPLRGPLNPHTSDHATDAYDTIAWLVSEVPESNGRVGTIGLSYDGFTALMSLVDPHPALKACVPINPMVDGWIGDDWFHNGAFHQFQAAPYTYAQTTTKDSSLQFPAPHYDAYDTYLECGSAGALGQRFGLDQLPFWQRLCEHPAYDEYWQGQAVDKILGKRRLTVPTLHVHSLWDAEDIYGAMAVFTALENDADNRTNNHLVIGPWGHIGPGFQDGYQLGAISFGSQTARHFRQNILLPFLDQHLRRREPASPLRRIQVFESGSNRWLQPKSWPPQDSKSDNSAIYLAADFRLDLSAPKAVTGHDEYRSDPTRPVTHVPRPVRPKSAPDSGWDPWLVSDQRFAQARPDVLSYCGPLLSERLRLAGEPVVHLYASTSGTDADWVVKLIDVYPDQYPREPRLGGYQLPIAMGIFRARYRESFSNPSPVPAEACLPYRFTLPHLSHALEPGHRLMVQIQSSWFPLVDRNPQTYVDNIFYAQAADYQPATQRIYRQAGAATRIELPLIP